MRGLLRTPPAVDTSHMTRITVSLERRLAVVRELLARGSASPSTTRSEPSPTA